MINFSCDKSSWAFKSSTSEDRQREKRRLLNKTTAVCIQKVQIWSNSCKANKKVVESITTLKKMPLLLVKRAKIRSDHTFICILSSNPTDERCLAIVRTPWPRRSCSLDTLSRLPQPVAQAVTIHWIFYAVQYLRTCTPDHSVQEGSYVTKLISVIGVFWYFSEF